MATPVIAHILPVHVRPYKAPRWTAASAHAALRLVSRRDAFAAAVIDAGVAMYSGTNARLAVDYLSEHNIPMRTIARVLFTAGQRRSR